VIEVAKDYMLGDLIYGIRELDCREGEIRRETSINLTYSLSAIPAWLIADEVV
jgi:hypothetical protein